MLIILPLEIQSAETSRLLSDDLYRPQYGSHGPIGQRPTYQPDPESLKRETEALKSICHAMSELVCIYPNLHPVLNVCCISNVIDVFTNLPEPLQQGQGPFFKTSGYELTMLDLVSRTPQLDRTTSHELLPEEIKCKTVKTSRTGPLISTLGRDVGSRKAVKDAMG